MNVRIKIATASIFATAALVLTLGATAFAEPPASAPSAGQPSASAAAAARDPKRLWCAEHEAYEDQCFICHPELREKGRLWCNEHGRYEDRCFLCHPELREANRPYCEKHFLYLDEDFLCHPELKKPQAGEPGAAREGHGRDRRDAEVAHDGHGHGHADAAASHADDAAPHAHNAAPRADGARILCEEHGVYEDECGICHPELAATLDSDGGLKVRMASRDAASKAGIESRVPSVVEIPESVECYAEVVFDESRFANVAAPADGVVRHAPAELGARVEPGSVLATLASAAVAEATSEAVLARQTLERERRLYKQHISAQKEVQAAEAAYRIARERLRALGFTDAEIESLAAGTSPGDGLNVRAPFGGEVVEKNAVVGARVDAGAALFTIADRSTMWAILNVPEAQLARVRPGQSITLEVDGIPGRTFAGTITWIEPRVDVRTRMARARAEIPNADGALRANAFAHARILVTTIPEALTVPSSAIQSIENRPFAFVELEPDLFEARAVTIDARHDDVVAVSAGLAPGERVVVANSFLLKSQLQISRLGAGCADH